MDNEDALRVDADWLQHYVGYARFQYYVEPRSSPASFTWLASAASRGDFARVRHCLAAGATATEPDVNGKTPLAHAVFEVTPEMAYYVTCVHGEIVRALTRSLARTPTQLEIYGVATHKKARKFRFHVKRRVDIIAAKFTNAARTGDLKTVRLMVEKDEISVHAVDKSTGEAAMSAALASGHSDVAMYLLHKGADAFGFCCVNGEHLSPLLVAIGTGDVALVREISLRGGLLSALWYAPRCALVEAATRGSFEMVETILDLSIKPMLHVLSLPWPIRGVLYFLQGSNQREKDLWLLLCAACWLQDKHLFAYLRRTHTELQDLEANPRNMAVLLAFAVYYEDEALVVELLERGVNVNHNIGITAMVAAVAVNSTRLLRLLIDNGGDTSIIYNNIVTDSPHVGSLLAVAVYANAIDCVRLLLPLEARLFYREQAMQEAAKQGNAELVNLLMDDNTMPSSERDQTFCLLFTKCPLVTDLLLTRWCPSKYPISALQGLFATLCRSNSDPDLLSIYIAHGLDITHDSTYTTSPLMEGVIWGANRLPALPVVKLLLENGVPSVTVKRGKTPEQDMDDETRHCWHANFKKRLFGRCRDLLAAHSSP